MDVLESEHLLNARLANTIAYAALHSHPRADIEKGAANAHTMYLRALDAMPYFTVGMDADGGARAERELAVKKWRLLQEQEKKVKS